MITCIPELAVAAAAAPRAKGSWAAAAYTPLIKHQKLQLRLVHSTFNSLIAVSLSIPPLSLSSLLILSVTLTDY